MKILAHRGYWDGNVPANSPAALRRAVENGFGFESDIRDFEGQLVISHNIADAESQSASEIFQMLADYQNRYCFAVNIKADGLKDLLLEHLRHWKISNYFTFDMSIPQAVEFTECGLTFFTRQSEIEPQPTLYQKAAGVWVDGFYSDDWITADLLNEHISKGKKVCVVSPELHGRAYTAFWEQLRKFSIDFSQVMLCTDHPAEAAKIFHQFMD